jgi:serpin B
MPIARLLISAAICSCIVVSASRIGIAAEGRVEPRVTQSANEFGAKVLAQLAGPGASANVVVSPFSLDSALGMLTLAADGKTLSLLQSVRGGERPPQNRLDEELKLQRALPAASTQDLTLRIANSAWLKLNAVPRPAFVYGLRGIYDADVTNVDFAKPGAAETINAWVKTNTEGLIPKIVDDLDARTEFMLINTTYFKGKWAVPFDASATQQAAFTRFDGSKRDVPLINASIELAYAAAEQWHAVRIPYHGNRFDMVVVTTKEPAEAANLRDKLGALGVLNALRSARFERQEVNLSLPRFRTEFGSDLTSTLGRLGLGPAFARTADYRGIAKSRLHAPAVIQRTVVEVSEEGTEAAAATAVGATRALAGPEPVTFAADRPFYFSIVDNETGAMLFMGLIADPAA